jgi:hypothetical protein
MSSTADPSAEVPSMPPGPPFSADVVADVHAGVYPEPVTVLLRQRMAADPEASALLAALDETVADLASWQDPEPIPMPAGYAARLDAALAQEAATRPGRIVSLDDARRRRTRRWATGLGVAAAIAAVVTVGAVVLRPSGGSGGLAGTAPATTGTRSTSSAVATPSGSAPGGQAIVVDPRHLENLLTQIAGTTNGGPYRDPARLSACLAANGIKGTNVLGVAAVTYQGAPAYAISLGLDDASAKILIVGDSCGSPGADLLTSQTTGR